MPRSVKDFTSRREHPHGNRIPPTDRGLTPCCGHRPDDRVPQDLANAPVLWTPDGIRPLNLAAVVFSWIVRGRGRRISSVDSVAGDPDNACRGGPVRECPVWLCRGEVSPCQDSAESARPEHCR